MDICWVLLSVGLQLEKFAISRLSLLAAVFTGVPSSRMNVLVYSGSAVLQPSLKQTLTSILSPHYTVQSISDHSLASQPWSTNCALLVCTKSSPSTAIIRHYVENGGALLDLSAGPFYDSQDPALESRRMRQSLRDLGLQTPESENAIVPSRPLPQFLTATPIKPDIVFRIMEALTGSMQPIEDRNDTFYFHNLSEADDLLKVDARSMSDTQSEPSSWQPKRIVVCNNGRLPSSQQTPLFDLGDYFKELSRAWEVAGRQKDIDSWAMGEALFYGQVVTSTQTMLDKYVLV